MNKPYESYNIDDVGAKKVSELTDVELTNLSNNQILIYDSTTSKWKNSDDVDQIPQFSVLNSTISNVQDGQSWVYNGSNSKWENTTTAGGTIQTLSDTNITNLSDNQILKYDNASSKWLNENNNLENLNNITLSNTADNEVLKYDNASSNWINEAVKLNEIFDVNITSLQNGEVLKYNNSTSKWENANNTDTLDELSDVGISNPAIKHTLVYNNSTSKFQNQLLNLDDLGDVNLTSLPNGGLIKYNTSSSKWEIGSLSLDNLSDTTITNIQAGNVLVWSGSAFVNQDMTDTIDELFDTNISNIANGNLLKYNSSNSKWENGTIGINNLSDVTITNPQNNNILKYNSSSGAWVNGDDLDVSTLDSLTNVTFTNLQNDNIIKYDSASSTWVNGTILAPLINNLTDVNITSLANGQILVYNSTSSKWENVAQTAELPSQTGNGGKFLITNGSAPSWSVTLPFGVLYQNSGGQTTNLLDSLTEIINTQDARASYLVPASSNSTNLKVLTNNGTTHLWSDTIGALTVTSLTINSSTFTGFSTGVTFSSQTFNGKKGRLLLTPVESLIGIQVAADSTWASYCNAQQDGVLELYGSTKILASSNYESASGNITLTNGALQLTNGGITAQSLSINSSVLSSDSGTGVSLSSQTANSYKGNLLVNATDVIIGLQNQSNASWASQINCKSNGQLILTATAGINSLTSYTSTDGNITLTNGNCSVGGNIILTGNLFKNNATFQSYGNGVQLYTQTASDQFSVTRMSTTESLIGCQKVSTSAWDGYLQNNSSGQQVLVGRVSSAINAPVITLNASSSITLNGTIGNIVSSGSATVGTAKIGSSGYGSSYAEFGHSARFGTGGTSNDYSFLSYSGGQTLINCTANSDIQLRSANSDVLLSANGTRLYSYKNLQIGGSALAVYSNGLFQFNYTGFNTSTTATNQTVTNGIYTVVFNGINYWWCRNSANQGGLIRANNFVQTFFPCDDNLKYNETTLTGGITTLKKLKPKKYKQVESLDDEQIDANAYDQIGFIAQEVAAIPELSFLVKDEPDSHFDVNGKSIKALQYNGIVALAVQAIKELTAQVEILQAKVAVLEG